jgi:hypothetical protein
LVYSTIGACVIANIIAAYTTGTPWRFIVASFVAIALAETADTEIYHKARNKSWLTRVSMSNAVAVPVDTAVFVLLAFYGNESGKIMWQIFQNDVLWKFAIATVIALNISKRAKNAYA